MDDLERVGNLVEAVLWGVVALVFVVRAARAKGVLRRIFGTLAVTFLLFGVSDIVESRTGAWWQPPWLLLWKSACVITLVLGFLTYYRIKASTSVEGERPDGGLEAPKSHAKVLEEPPPAR